MKPHKRFILVNYFGNRSMEDALSHSKDHLQQTGCPAWHYVIDKFGRLNSILHFTETAGNEDTFNTTAVHIAVLASAHKFTTRAQELTLFELLHSLTQSKVPQAEIRTTDEFADTKINSGFNIRDWMNEFDLEAALVDVYCNSANETIHRYE
jgi:N-acetylmuramoyl-L-alanine amidase